MTAENENIPFPCIVFRVIGYEAVGMGHVYRALTLAHELTGYKVIFVSDEKSQEVVKDLISDSFTVKVFSKNALIREIISLEPSIVVNDILDTDVNDVVKFQENGIKVVNFEDLGAGAKHADLVINELYDEPQFEGKNILWGRDHFFVREEFCTANPNQSVDLVRGLLLAFGGVDQHNLSTKIFKSIYSACLEAGVRIYIVTGPGFAGYQELRNEIQDYPGVELTHRTGVISRIMEKVQIAISSNGRTVYELAHMNIPGIIIPQHAREKTHSFARSEHGFILMDTYREGVTEPAVTNALALLLNDSEYRRKLFELTTRFRFDKNKSRVVSTIKKLISA